MREVDTFCPSVITQKKMYFKFYEELLLIFFVYLELPYHFLQFLFELSVQTILFYQIEFFDLDVNRPSRGFAM